MLGKLDQALAGAIDVVADDISATVKSVKEQGMMRTLGDAVEDAAGLVGSGAKSVLGGLGRKAPEKAVSTHSGITGSSYADLCAGRPTNGGGFAPKAGGPAAFPYTPNGGGAAFPYTPNGGGAAFPYTPNGGGAAFPYTPNGGGAAFPYTPSPAPGRGGAAKASGGFGPGIGIQRNPGSYNAGGVQVFAKPGSPAAPAPFTPSAGSAAGYQGGGSLPGAAPQSYSTPSTTTPSTKDPTLSQNEIIARFAEIKDRDPSNNICFDCKAASAEWASVSFGVFMCIECSGHHRQMGTHISRIRSSKMDSWTDRQMRVFDHGGNKRLAEFFACNGVPENPRFQRYHSPAAEWYREAWVKNRTLEREVPPPPQGVLAGPCEVKSKPAAKAAPAAPAVDLLDMGGAAETTQSKPAPAADLLELGGPSTNTATSTAGATPATAEADLLGVGNSSSHPDSDLLRLGSLSGGPASSAGNGGGDLLGLAAVAANARPPAAAAASTHAPVSVPLEAAAVPPMMFAAPPSAPATAASAQSFGAPVATAGAAGTLAGGAKLATEKKVDDDPFAMALSKWGM